MKLVCVGFQRNKYQIYDSKILIKFTQIVVNKELYYAE